MKYFNFKHYQLSQIVNIAGMYFGNGVSSSNNDNIYLSINDLLAKPKGAAIGSFKTRFNNNIKLFFMKNSNKDLLIETNVNDSKDSILLYDINKNFSSHINDYLKNK